MILLYFPLDFNIFVMFDNFPHALTKVIEVSLFNNRILQENCGMLKIVNI